MAEPERDDLLRGSGEDVVAAMNAWKDLPAAHLKVALNFWNERMTADHELRMTKERNRNRLDIMGMIAAFVISISSVGSAVVFGAIENYVMAGVMLGPSVFAIMKLFVTRKADKVDLSLDPPRNGRAVDREMRRGAR